MLVTCESTRQRIHCNIKIFYDIHMIIVTIFTYFRPFTN